MKKGIKLELYRAFHNIYFYVALFIGCFIAVLQFALEVLPKAEAQGVFFGNMRYPSSVFNTCMALNMGGSVGYFYYFSIILIGTLPFAMSYYTDLREGYIKNVCIRVNQREYLLGKYIAVFSSAGVVCIVPLILNLMLTMYVIPALIPHQGLGSFPLSGNAMWKGLFYSHPFVYLFVFFVVDFLLCGLFACTALSISRFVHNRYIVLFTPFVLFFLLQTVMTYTPFPSAGGLFAMLPSQRVWQKPEVLLVEIVVLFILSFGTLMVGGRKRDAI